MHIGQPGVQHGQPGSGTARALLARAMLRGPLQQRWGDARQEGLGRLPHVETSGSQGRGSLLLREAELPKAREVLAQGPRPQAGALGLGRQVPVPPPGHELPRGPVLRVHDGSPRVGAVGVLPMGHEEEHGRGAAAVILHRAALEMHTWDAVPLRAEHDEVPVPQEDGRAVDGEDARRAERHQRSPALVPVRDGVRRAVGIPEQPRSRQDAVLDAELAQQLLGHFV
mmetsp:Transcript_30222/g.80390  ORF Transcript_30222/g.80390 Transcript_30222/m.80390 type:complete len:226 (-) Transcript_30222:2184-2861(-)